MQVGGQGGDDVVERLGHRGEGIVGSVRALLGQSPPTGLFRLGLHGKKITTAPVVRRLARHPVDDDLMGGVQPVADVEDGDLLGGIGLEGQGHAGRGRARSDDQ